MAIESEVTSHYAVPNLEQRLLAALAASGKTPDALMLDDLAAFDQHHTGGAQTTHDLLSQLTIRPDSHLLDVGSGVGGPARYVADKWGCRVTGIDLTPEYVEVAKSLTRRVGLEDRVSFHCGSALALPFTDAVFDGAYMLHVGMNIADKPALFAEVRRVLRPRGFFAIFDMMRTGEGQVQYPTGWAATSATSFLESAAEYRSALQRAMFEVVAERDRHQFALEFFKRAAEATGPTPNALFSGDSGPQRLANVQANLAAHLICPVEMIARVT